MSRGTLVITVPAQRDLVSLWRFIAQDNADAADRMIDRILARTTLLSEMPEIGRRRPELGNDKRSMVVEPYLIIYQLSQHGIAVLRVLHTAQDIDEITDESPLSEDSAEHTIKERLQEIDDATQFITHEEMERYVNERLSGQSDDQQPDVNETT